ncbi:hypothetical protein [Chitinophaga nivalis]|uniref:DUF1795 domain-containing protein n=1 Tax=Chitinophaga nivalis TaxID=2991709 RepID=A0ABT3IQ10_9BACT|nr:hypothetical protein [Chitinophaga nivalis]MCW3464250.1 hypothetical protein [Chitinophaga nivalis]MCW3486059.1 hypothetical protein [Chitinophaga nivalis]
MSARRIPVVLLLSTSFYVIACNGAAQKAGSTVLAEEPRLPPTDTMITVGDTIHTDLLASWNAFGDYNGKYAMETNLFEAEPLKTRLNILLNKAKRPFFDRLQVTPPVEVENRILFNEGYMPGKSGYDEAAIAVDMERDIIYLGFTVNRSLMLFSEKGDTDYPEKFLQWMQQFE